MACCGNSWTVNVTVPPSGVYLTAFDNRFNKIWFRRSLSIFTCSCFNSLLYTSNVWPFVFICGRIIESMFSTSSTILSSDRFNVVFPASILLISKISLIRPSKCWLEDVIFLVYSRTLSGFFASLAKRAAKPTMAFIGVRISWLILERNELLARFASSAIRNACSAVSLERASISFDSSNLAFSSSWRRRFSCSWRNRRSLLCLRVMDTAARISATRRIVTRNSSSRTTAPTIPTVPEATNSAGIKNSSSVSYSSREVTQ